MTERGCGKRKKGGIYAVNGGGNTPLEAFLLCPPVIPEMDVPALGMKPISDPRGTVHLLDWVGQDSYPNVWDFLEEVRRMGLSRRVPASAPLGLLTRQSRILLVHKTAYVHNRAAMPHTAWACPTGKHKPGEVDEMCLGMPKYLLDMRDKDEAVFPEMPRRDGIITLRRVMPSFSYVGYQTPDGYTADYEGAIFASFPITRFEVVSGGTPEEMARAHAALSAAQLPVVEIEA